MSHREKDSTESRKFDKLLFSIYLLGWETLVSNFKRFFLPHECHSKPFVIGDRRVCKRVRKYYTVTS